MRGHEDPAAAVVRARGAPWTVLVSLAAFLAALATGAAPALATDTHAHLSRFSEVPAEGPLHEHVRLPGPFRSSSSMTVDSGDLYIVEGQGEESSRLDVFNASTNAFVTQFPFPAGHSLEFIDQGVAVGHEGGEAHVYAGADRLVEESPKGSVAVFSTSGSLESVWTGAATPTAGFRCFECGARGDVAVDNSASLTDWAAGDVYVADPGNAVVDVFEPETGGGEKYVTRLTGTPGGQFTEPSQLAVSPVNGDLLVSDRNVLDVFEPTLPGEYEFVMQLTGTPGGSFVNVRGVAVDSNGDIYVADEGAVIDQFGPTGTYMGHLTETPAGPLGGIVSIAVDEATNLLYVNNQGEEFNLIDVFGPSIIIPDVTTAVPTNVKPQSATINGTVNPDGEGEASCRFLYGTSVELGHEIPCSASVPNGSSPVGVHADLAGLEPDRTYYYRLQASNANGTNPGEAYEDQIFTTPGPGIDEESVTGVTSASATLNAKIDPHGVATSYYFQYGTSTSYESSLPAPPGLSLGSGEEDLSVSVHLQGLPPATTFHFRVVTVSQPGGEPLTFGGADQSFTTQAAAGEFSLPDGRQWEMVTPPEKYGSDLTSVGNEQGADIQAAADGSGITFGATSPFTANPAGSRSLEITQVISTRTTPGDWATQDITTAHNEGASGLAVGHSAEYKLFSNDLSLGMVEPAGRTPLPPLPAGAEKTIYLRKANGEYEAIVSAANVPPGTKFGGNGEGAGAVGFDYGTPDLHHVIVRSSVPLTELPGDEGGLYEWTAGHFEPVDYLPGGELNRGASLGDRDYDMRNAISADGSRLVLEMETGQYVQRRFLRDINRKETIEIDAAQGVAEPISPQSQYQTASSDDSRVFFTSPNRLTEDSTAGNNYPSRPDLYVYELTSTPSEPLAGRLTDLTVDPNPGEHADVEGVLGAGEDGGSIYFIASGVLAAGAQRGGNNLYVRRYDTTLHAWASPTFIAALSGGDSASWGNGYDQLKGMTSRVSPNGRYVTFMSERDLTGYENRDANSGVPDEEVFLYDADANKLVCASCNPSGTRPVGLLEGGAYEENLVDYAKLWQERWTAAIIPGWTTEDLSNALYQSRYLSSSGRLFFDSSDSLVPGDVNGKEDVYEYEPEGVGSCQSPGYGHSASDVFNPAAGGCVALISAGTSSEESAFMDASETGGDVFFMTLSKLSTQDFDTSLDIYDAHACTSSAPCAPPVPLAPPPCTTGDACKPAPTPQPTILGAPASATFSGAGNLAPHKKAAPVLEKPLTRAQKLSKALKACKRVPKRKRPACIRTAKRRFGKASREGK